MRQWIALFLLLCLTTTIDLQAQELLWSTYLGGQGDETPGDIFVDENGNLFITGNTTSHNFPTTSNAMDEVYSGNTDGFITKFNFWGDLVYSTFIGENGHDWGKDIHVDDEGNIILLMGTTSTQFQTTSNAYRTTGNGQSNRVVIKLDPLSNDIHSATYFWGDVMDVDPHGNVVIAQTVGHGGYPTTNGAFDATFNGDEDVYLAKLSEDGSSLIYGSYLGGSGIDGLYGMVDIDVDATGSLYAAFSTMSEELPTTENAFYRQYHDSQYERPDIAIAKLNPDGSDLEYFTYLGGTVDDVNPSIIVDRAGSLFITGNHHRECYLIGENAPVDFPTTSGAYDRHEDRHYSAFVTKLNPTGSDLHYSTFFGGDMINNFDIMDGCRIALLNNGQAVIVGEAWMYDSNFPVTPDAIRESNTDPGSNPFMTIFSADGSDLAYSSYLGGDSENFDTHYFRVVADNANNVYVVGATKSNHFPTTDSGFDRTHNGGDWDLFVMKFAMDSSSDLRRREIESPAGFYLEQNFPNPFNPATTIVYKVPETLHVKLTLYNLMGQEIDVLIDREQDAGLYEFRWHAYDYPAGIYLYKLEAGSFTMMKKLVLQK